MHPHFILFGLTFYWYGLIIGLAIALTLLLVDYWIARFERSDIQDTKRPRSAEKARVRLFFQQWSIVLILGGLIGARLWHVATDWPLYQNQLFAALSISQGGLSIFGALAGGIITVLLLQKVVPSLRWLSLRIVGDVLVFGLPFGQALGRLGNWVNQELYGWPSTLPWAITIDAPYRLPGLEDVSRYHPLFLYEAVLLLALGGSIWWLGSRRPQLFGTGFFAAVYLTAYCVIRFFLDFLRIDRTVVVAGLGANQVVVAVVFVVVLLLWKKQAKKYV